MGYAVTNDQQAQQLALSRGWVARLRTEAERLRRVAPEAPRCAGCREKEARYGFRVEEGEPDANRPHTLCFSCFRVEIGRREAVAERLARGWNARQASLPLQDTLDTLSRRRRRAQIAARHAVGA